MVKRINAQSARGNMRGTVIHPTRTNAERPGPAVIESVKINHAKKGVMIVRKFVEGENILRK